MITHKHTHVMPLRLSPRTCAKVLLLRDKHAGRVCARHCSPRRAIRRELAPPSLLPVARRPDRREGPHAALCCDRGVRAVPMSLAQVPSCRVNRCRPPLEQLSWPLARPAEMAEPHRGLPRQLLAPIRHPPTVCHRPCLARKALGVAPPALEIAAVLQQKCNITVVRRAGAKPCRETHSGEPQAELAAECCRKHTCARFDALAPARPGADRDPERRRGWNYKDSGIATFTENSKVKRRRANTHNRRDQCTDRLAVRCAMLCAETLCRACEEPPLLQGLPWPSPSATASPCRCHVVAGVGVRAKLPLACARRLWSTPLGPCFERDLQCVSL